MTESTKIQKLIAAIAKAEQMAHRFNFSATAHALNAAKNKAGWEAARHLERELVRT